MKRVNPAILSQERRAVLGVATIMILLVHSVPYLPTDNKILLILSKCCGYGSLGVPIFAFLSGIGIYYSLSNNKLNDYYWNRINRTFIPFVIMAIIACSIFYLFLEWKPLTFIEEITTLSFWLNHHGPWYIAMLVPLYLISPVYYHWNLPGGVKCVIVSIFTTTIAVAVNNVDSSLYHHICNVYCSSVIYFVGMYIGEMIYKKKHVWALCVYLPILLHIIQIVFFRIFHNTIMDVLHSPIRDLTYVLLASSVTWILSYFFSMFNDGVWKKLWNKLGNISLESYLFNTYFGYAIHYMLSRNVLPKDDVLYGVYVITCIIGLLMSTPYQILIKKHFYVKSIQKTH